MKCLNSQQAVRSRELSQLFGNFTDFTKLVDRLFATMAQAVAEITLEWWWWWGEGWGSPKLAENAKYSVDLLRVDLSPILLCSAVHGVKQCDF